MFEHVWYFLYVRAQYALYMSIQHAQTNEAKYEDIYVIQLN